MESSKKLLKIIDRGEPSKSGIGEVEEMMRKRRVNEGDYALLKCIEDLYFAKEFCLDLEFVDSFPERDQTRVEITVPRSFDVVLTPGSDGFFVECINLPGCFSQGETEEEALANVKEAIEGYLECIANSKMELKKTKEVFHLYI